MEQSVIVISLITYEIVFWNWNDDKHENFVTPTLKTRCSHYSEGCGKSTSGRGGGNLTENGYITKVSKNKGTFMR